MCEWLFVRSVRIFMNGSVRDCSVLCLHPHELPFAASSAAFARLDVAMAVDLGPFEVGQIWALHREGYSHRQIADKVTRGRDQLGPSPSTVGEVVRHSANDD